MDARVIKTKTTLLATFRKMLGELRFEDITVNDLCQRAGIRRATFYKHFSDKYDFLKFFVSSLRAEFDKNIWKKKKPDATINYYVVYIRSLINFLLKNETIVKRILESEIMPTVVEIIKEQNYHDTRDRIQKSVEEGMQIPASVDTVAMLLTGGISHAVVAWFKNGMSIPADEFIDEIANIIASILTKPAQNA